MSDEETTKRLEQLQRFFSGDFNIITASSNIEIPPIVAVHDLDAFNVADGENVMSLREYIDQRVMALLGSILDTSMSERSDT